MEGKALHQNLDRGPDLQSKSGLLVQICFANLDDEEQNLEGPEGLPGFAPNRTKYD